MSILASCYQTEYISKSLDGREFVDSVYGFEEEYNTIRNNIGIMDYSDFGIIKVSGENVMDFIQLITTRDFEYFAPERARTCLLLDNEAKIVSCTTVLNFEDYYYFLVYPGHISRTLEWLQTNASEGILIEDLNGKISAIAIEGPMAWKVAEHFTPFEISSLSYMSFTQTTWQSTDIYISRIGYAGEYGYIFFSDVNIAPLLWKEIVKLGEPFSIKLCGLAVFEACMQEIRTPNISIEVPSGANLVESRLQWLIDFTKSGYIGFDAVVKMVDEKSEKGIVGFFCDSSSGIVEGNDVYAADDKIGKVLSCFPCPSLSKNIGLAFIDSMFAQAGLELTANNTSILTCSCPYVLPRSWSEKII